MALLIGMWKKKHIVIPMDFPSTFNNTSGIYFEYKKVQYLIRCNVLNKHKKI